MTKRTGKTRTGRETCTKTVSHVSGKRGISRHKKYSTKAMKTLSEDRTEATEYSVRERHKRKPDLRSKLSRDLFKLKNIVYGPKRTYLRDEAPGTPVTGGHTPITKSAVKELDDNDSTNSADRTGKSQAPCDSSNATPNSGSLISNDRGLKWAQTCCHAGLRPLLKEFSGIRKFLPAGIKTEVFNKNGSKNRYMDVLCLDDTRVILKGRPKDNDYIHANWVVLPSLRKYICTQAPLEETAEDFWLMVFKENVPVIIMLCDVIESGEVKCVEYYPTAVGKELTFGEIRVKNLQKEKSIDTIICFTMTVEMSNETHKVQHYKWADWPDRGAPASASPVVELLRKTKPMFAFGPVLVHCSAGIGRTGTYCAVDYALDRLALGGSLCIADVVKEIRKQRLHSVQSTLQYLYLHDCLVEYLVVTKVMQRDSNARKFQRDYEKYLKKFNERNTTTNSIRQICR